MVESEFIPRPVWLTQSWCFPHHTTLALCRSLVVVEATPSHLTPPHPTPSSLITYVCPDLAAGAAFLYRQCNWSKENVLQSILRGACDLCHTAHILLLPPPIPCSEVVLSQEPETFIHTKMPPGASIFVNCTLKCTNFLCVHLPSTALCQVQ